MSSLDWRLWYFSSRLGVEATSLLSSIKDPVGICEEAVGAPKLHTRQRLELDAAAALNSFQFPLPSIALWPTTGETFSSLSFRFFEKLG